MICKRFHNIDQNTLHSSWSSGLIKPVTSSNSSNSVGTSIQSPLSSLTETFQTLDQLSISVSNQPENYCKRIAFIYDSNLTAFLMVGNLSQVFYKINSWNLKHMQ
uniref:Protein FAM91A1 (Trinotate prediction) n=1 Tax=Myxobolus squamalis TaxID=59785 RepID=A0A6B2G2G0_MYXSQ